MIFRPAQNLVPQEEPRFFNRPKFWGIIGLIFTIVLGIALLVAALWSIIGNPNIAFGSDVTSFVHTTKMMVDYFLANHHFLPIDLTWYAGFEHEFTPPLIYLFLGIPFLITKSFASATHFVHFFALFTIFLSTLLIMRKEKYPTWNAFTVAVVYTFMPQIFMSMQTYTKLIALFVLPIQIYLVNRMLDNKENPIKYITFLALSMAFTVYAHPMNGIVYSIAICIYMGLLMLFSGEVRFKRVLAVLIGIVVGILITSSFLLPFIMETPQGTFSKVTLWERSIIVNPLGINYRVTWEIFGGWVVLFLVPIFVVIRKREVKLLALYLTGIICLLISFAYSWINLGAFFPFNLAYAYIWLYITAFSVAVLYGMLIPTTPVKKLSHLALRVGITVIVLVAYYLFIRGPSNFGKLYNAVDNPSEMKMAAYLDTISNDARIFYSHAPLGEIGWSLWYYSKNPKPMVEGHYYGISRAGEQIAYINDALNNGYSEYILKKIRNLNVRYFIANFGLWNLKDPNTKEFIGRSLIEKLQSNGYEKKFETNMIDDPNDALKKDDDIPKYKLYYLDQPSAYVQPVNENILVIGKYSPTFAAAISPLKLEALEANDIYLDNFDLDYLKRFKTVVLYGFGYHDKAKAEQTARDYVKSGGNLIIDLFGIDKSLLDENPSFLGVTGNKVTFIGSNNPIVKNDESRGLLPDNFYLPNEILDDPKSQGDLTSLAMKEWNALEYLGLDDSWARLQLQDDFYSILGTKTVEGKKVTFLGLNIIYHLYNSHDSQELELMKKILLAEKGETKTDQFYEAKEETLTPVYWRFSINSEKDKLSLISLAYSPHWRVLIDNQPVRVYQSEDLMVVKVPAGRHILEVKYVRNIYNIIGWILTISALSLVIIHYLFNHFRRKGNA